LDHLTVGLAHPDAIAAVLNPVSEITAHFATSPFHEAEMKAGLKTVTSGYQIMGGEVSNLVFVTTEKFRGANPTVYAAVVAALDEAIQWTNADKRRAAKLYMEMTKEKKLTEDDVVAIISAPGFDFTKVPKKTFRFAEFMHQIGARSRPSPRAGRIFISPRRMASPATDGMVPGLGQALDAEIGLAHVLSVEKLGPCCPTCACVTSPCFRGKELESRPDLLKRAARRPCAELGWPALHRLTRAGDSFRDRVGRRGRRCQPR